MCFAKIIFGVEENTVDCCLFLLPPRSTSVDNAKWDVNNSNNDPLCFPPFSGGCLPDKQPSR